MSAVQMWLSAPLFSWDAMLQAPPKSNDGPFFAGSVSLALFLVRFGGGGVDFCPFSPVFPSPDQIIPCVSRLHPEDKIGRRGL